jgi:prepilin-type N-terminal cleavage/methylation domain-containing protein
VAGGRRRAGFTLIELILSLVMVAMLAGALYMTITVAARARESTAATVAPIRTALLAADLVRQDFEGVLPPTGTLAYEFVGTSANGADSLDFYCMGNDAGWNLADVPPTGQELQDGPQPWSDGLRHVVLTVRTDVNPPVLVRQVTRNLLPTAPVDPDEEVLCRNVRSFTLRYFDGTTWQEEWDSVEQGDVLPLAVQMTLEVMIDSPRVGEAPRAYKVVRTFPLACANVDAITGGAQ